MKVAVSITKTHNPFDEDYWASCLRENLTSSSYGEGLETGRESAQEPRQSFTRQSSRTIRPFSTMYPGYPHPLENVAGKSKTAAENP